ncbi:hypothetical protein Hanom_Chr15g01359911 [Helianthus anomalus]
MIKWYRVLVPIPHQSGCIFGTVSAPVFIGFYLQISVSYQYRPVPTGTEPYRTRYIRYWYPLLEISVMVFSIPVGTELINSCSNVAMQVIALFRLLFIHTVGKLYFV